VPASVYNVTFDAKQPRNLGRFWSAVTGYVMAEQRDDFVRLRAPDDRGVRQLLFIRVDDPTPGKNRMHVDLASAEPDAEIDRLVSLGASLVDEPVDGARGTASDGSYCGTRKATSSASAPTLTRCEFAPGRAARILGGNRRACPNDRHLRNVSAYERRVGRTDSLRATGTRENLVTNALRADLKRPTATEPRSASVARPSPHGRGPSWSSPRPHSYRRCQ
jgi:hypothetical protein